MKLAALGALALFLSYPPFPLPFLSFIALVPAILLLQQAEGAADARLAFRFGLWYGLFANALVLYWMVVALWHFTPLSALGYLASLAVLAIFTAALFWFVIRLRLAAPAVPLFVVFPVAWTALEWLIGHLGDVSFPWLGLGTSLADAPILVQWADLAGARGVTLWVAWCNVMLVEAAKDVRGVRYAVRRAAPVAVTILLALGYGAWRMRTLPMRDVGVVALLQPNEGFREKWEPAHRDSVFTKLITMSRAALARGRPGLIIWPEAAVPDVITWHPAWEAQVTLLARESHTPILVGTIYAERPWQQGDLYYNATLLVDSTGDWRRHPIYAKHYLVPVTERVPFVPVRVFRAIPGLARWSGGFARGQTLPLYEIGLGRFGVIICYESAFEDFPRRYRAMGADFLVNVTNDAWFGRTTAPYQHASHLVLRAIETRMGVARAANSGISQFVDPLGRTFESTSLDSETTVIGMLRTSDVMTLHVRLGDWVGLLVVVLTLGGIAFLVKRRFAP
ncbi:MAG: apolipoprotein N-acyltransferase [Gemmatimonadales bacterium]